MRRELRGFKQRPTQRGGALPGELAELGVAVGAVNPDVQAGHPDGLAAGVHA